MPTGAAPVASNVVHVMDVSGVAGCGENVSGRSVVARVGVAGSAGSSWAVVVTTPANAVFFVIGIETWPFLFWPTLIATDVGTTRTAELPSRMPTWSIGSGGLVAGGNAGPG